MTKKDDTFYKEALEAMKDFVLIKGPKSRLLWANKAFRDYYGMTEEALQDIIDGPQSDPDDTLQYVKDDQTVFDTQTHLNIPSEPVTNGDGQAHDFHTIKSPIFQQDKIIRTVGVSRLLDSKSHQISQDSPNLENKAFTAPLRSITEGFPIPMLMLDSLQRVVQVNPLWKKFFGGYTDKTNSFFNETFPLLKKLQPNVDEAFTLEKSTETTLDFIIDQKIAYFKFLLSPWRYPNGSFGGIIIVASQLTELVTAHKKAEDSSRRLTLALQASNVGVWDWRIKENHLIWDDQMYELYGIKKASFSGAYEAWVQGVHPEDVEKGQKSIQDAIEGRAKFDTEFRVLWPNGNIRTIRALAEVYRDDNGEAIQMVGVNWDITKEKEFAHRIVESNQQYYLVLEGASVGIWEWKNLNAKGQYWSSRFYYMLGYNNGEIEATVNNFKSLFHPEDFEAAFSAIEAHLKSNSAFDQEFRLKTKGGEYKWFRGTGQAAFDENGKPERMVGSIQDIHSAKAYENELKRSNEELDQFSYIASHDLREPLRGMRNFAQFLMADYSEILDEKGIQYLNTIQKLGGRLDRYLDSLRYYSRVGREKMAFQQMDLNTLFKEEIDTVVNSHPKEDIQIRLTKPLPNLFCDPLKISKIVQNILQNAVKYNQARKKVIDISWEDIGERAYQFSITDNGIGIRQEHQKLIFNIFKRLHGKEEYGGGTGLGLTLVKKAVERHGGEIWVHSDGKNGSTFHFTIQEEDHDKAPDPQPNFADRR